MSDTNNIGLQGDITLDFDNADKARERRKRRSTIFEKSRTLANSASFNNSNAMEVDSLDKDWEKRYMEDMKKEINDWKCITKSLKDEFDSLTKKVKNRESLTNLVPSQILMKDKNS
ncbi:hypothetical protein LSTR_LSTR017529 [Laodelphax striatellus]|uniref:Uncharacterized protein n=1 Tax=Laodelphax striatellus TaxID=195883 RepID=A0A482XUY0_LAOST|nr:hypothetical protein LSTR_LSTR017529 [Laodelphax striatellus]